MSKFFQKINLNELVFDFTMLIMAVLLYSAVFPKGIIPQAGEHTFLHQNLIVLAEFIFAFVLGKHGDAFTNKKMEKAKWREYYYYFASLYIIAVAYISIPIILDAVGLFSYAVGLFACMMGFMTGIATWKEDSYMGQQVKTRKEKREEKKEKGNDSQWEKAFASMVKDYPILIGIPFISIFYGIVFLVDKWFDLSGFIGVLAFIGIILIPIIGMFIVALSSIGIAMIINKIRAYSKMMDRALMKVIFPMSLVLLILIWERIYHSYILGNDAGIVKVVFVSIFLGLIPYRILLLIKPPFNKINFSIGVVVFVAYFLSMFL